MKNNISILLVGFSVCSYAQTLDQQVISGGGGHFNEQLQYTIGETVVQTESTDEIQLTQGFHQSTFVPRVADLEPLVNAKLSVYPNPTNDFIYLNSDTPGLTYNLIGLDGKYLLKGRLNAGITQIDLSQFANGIYFIELLSVEKSIKKTFKITKQ